MEAIRIVLAEDHSLMREGTRRVLEQCSDMTVVGEAEDGEQALALIERLQPDIAILDIRMPKLSGIEVVRRMKELSANTKALMLTAYDDDDYILALMELGAAGYLLKTMPTGRLIEVVRSIYQGEPVLDPVIVAKVAQLWAHRRTVAEEESANQLSSRELEVLKLAARGLRSKAIADELYISVRTVEGHFNHIFDKLGVSSRLEAVLYALSRQLIKPETGRKP